MHDFVLLPAAQQHGQVMDENFQTHFQTISCDHSTTQTSQTSQTSKTHFGVTVQTRFKTSSTVLLSAFLLGWSLLNEVLLVFLLLLQRT